MKRVAQNFELESATYVRQLNFILAAGAAAGLVILLNFAGGRKNLTDVFVIFAPSYVCFHIALVTSVLTIFFKSRKDSAMAEHFSESHNREEVNVVPNSHVGMTLNNASHTAQSPTLAHFPIRSPCTPVDLPTSHVLTTSL
jgi:hypothetical protein